MEKTVVGQFSQHFLWVARPDLRMGVANRSGAFIPWSHARHAHPVGLGVPPTSIKLTHDRENGLIVHRLAIVVDWFDETLPVFRE